MQWESEMFASTGARQPPELRHYGIKGQRWGQRRFQEEDGTYTAAGKERYGRVSGKVSGKGKTGKKNSRNWKPEDAENLSDEELNRRNNRMQREQQYKDATTPKWKKEAKQTAKDWTKEAVKRIFVATAVTLAVAAMTQQYKKAQKKIGEYSHHKISELRQPKATKNAIRNAVNLYNSSGRKARYMHSKQMAKYDRVKSRSSSFSRAQTPQNIRFEWNARR